MEREEEVRESLDAARGILFGLALGVCFWALAAGIIFIVI